MKTFTANYLLESKRLLKKKIIGLFLFLSLLSLYFFQIGLNNYINLIGNREEFQDIEQLKVKQYINYNQYGSYGFRVLFIPSPLSIYFVNSSTISGLTANVDVGERLYIYNSFKGRSLFADKGGGFKDFSGIMLLLGGLLVLYLGYESFIYRDYLRFMSGFVNHKNIFLSTVLSRVFILVFLFLLNAGISLIILEINGIQFSGGEYAHFFTYLVILMLVLVFFFALGTIAGSFKSGFAGFVMVIISWFALVFLFPGIVNSITSRKADDIVSNYKLELQKLKSLMDFERQSLEELGATTKDNIDAVRKSVEEDFIQKGFKKIQSFEERLRNEMEENIRYFEFLSSLFPSTFYLSAGNEISSKGYENFILFFDYIRELKKKFLRFHVDHRFYSDDPFDAPKKVESFIKGNENLFHARSRTPRGFTRGILLILVYIVGLFIVSYSRFKQALRL